MNHNGLFEKDPCRIPRKLTTDTSFDEIYLDVGRTQQHIMQMNLDSYNREGKLIGRQRERVDVLMALLTRSVLTLKVEYIDRDKKLELKRNIQRIVMEINEEILRLNDIFVPLSGICHKRIAENEKQGRWQ